jgi:predicted amidohydrolase YtcJ
LGAGLYSDDRDIAILGPERARWLTAYRSLLDHGVKVASHSDYSVAPYHPLLGIHCIVNRVTADGRPIALEQGLTPKEALRTYTIYAAYSTFEDNIKGSIEKGKLADLVVLSENPLNVPHERIKDIQVRMTIIGGKVVYEND